MESNGKDAVILIQFHIFDYIHMCLAWHDCYERMLLIISGEMYCNLTSAILFIGEQKCNHIKN